MGAGLWEVHVAKAKSMCHLCCERIHVGDLMLIWISFDGSKSEKVFFHSKCAVEAGRRDKRFTEVSCASIRRSIGLNHSQRDQLQLLIESHKGDRVVTSSSKRDSVAASSSKTSSKSLGSSHKSKDGPYASKKPTALAKQASEVNVGLPLALVQREQGQLRVDLAGKDQLRLAFLEGKACTATAERINTWPELQRGSEKNTWTFAVSSYKRVASRISGGVVDLPVWLPHTWAAAHSLLSCTKGRVSVRYERETPPSVKKAVGTLLPYQLEAVRFGIARKGRMLCGDQMGLGKTLIALALAFEYQDEWPVLVICPAMLRHQWQEQILHWLRHVVKPGDVQMILHGTDKIIKKIKFVIVPYSFVPRTTFQQTGAGKTFQVVICDESHYIKDHEAQRTQACVPLLQQARRAVLLSGTPTVNNATELHPQLEAVLGQPIASFKEFAYRYAYHKVFKIPGRRKTIERWHGARREQELEVLLRSLMVRRKIDDVMDELPKKRRQRVVVPASDARALGEATLSVPVDSDSKKAPADRLKDVDHGGLTQAFKHLCEAKLKSSAEYVDHFLEGLSSKALLFAHHHVMLDAIYRVLKAKKIKFIRIDGKTPMSKRYKYVKEFQKDPTVTVALLGITACSEGLDLSVAQVVVFCELYWVPGVMEQCEARAHRKGQQSMVDVQYVCVKGSLDDIVFQTLCAKTKATTAILDGKAQALESSMVHAQRPVGLLKRPACSGLAVNFAKRSRSK